MVQVYVGELMRNGEVNILLRLFFQARSKIDKRLRLLRLRRQYSRIHLSVKMRTWREHQHI